MSTDLELVTNHLCDGLSILAKSANEQIEYLRTTDKFILPVDELAQENEHWTQSYISMGGAVAVETLREIDALLAKHSGQHNAVYWTEDALQTEPMWEEVRRLSSLALSQLFASVPNMNQNDRN